MFMYVRLFVNSFKILLEGEREREKERESAMEID